MMSVKTLCACLGRIAMLASLWLVSGCAFFNDYRLSYPTWIPAPLVADGSLTAGGYDPWGASLAVDGQSQAVLKFSLATLPNGPLPAIDGSLVGTVFTTTRSSGNYTLNSSKIANARLVVLVERVLQPGYLAVQAWHGAAGDCFSRESEAPNATCSQLSGTTAAAKDIDMPANALHIALPGLYSLDMTDLVRARVASDAQPTFVVSAVQGSFVLGSKEFVSSTDSGLSHGAQLLITLTDAIGSATNYYNVRSDNVRRSASDSAVADQVFSEADPLWLQGGQGGDGAYAIVPNPPTPWSDMLQITDTFLGKGFKSTVVANVVSPTSSTPLDLDWYVTTNASNLTWNNWSHPASGTQSATTSLAPSIARQVVMADVSNRIADNLVGSHPDLNNSGPDWSIAVTSAGAQRVQFANTKADKPQTISVIYAKPSAGIAADRLDYTDPPHDYAWANWGPDRSLFPTGTSHVHNQAGYFTGFNQFGDPQLRLRARLGRYYLRGAIKPYFISKLVNDPSLPASESSSNPYTWWNKMNSLILTAYLGLPETGPTAIVPAKEFAPEKFSDFDGFQVNPGSANNVAGSFDGTLTVQGHNKPLKLKFHNLPMPVPTLSGPTSLSIPADSSSLTVEASAATPFVLHVDDAEAAALAFQDDLQNWSITSSNPADILPAPLTQSDGQQSFAITFVGAGPRTLTVTSTGTSEDESPITAQLPIFVQATTDISLSGPSQVVYGQPVTLSATVTGSTAAANQQIALNKGAEPMGSATLDAAQSAQWMLSALEPGTYAFQATQAGDVVAGVQPSVSAPWNVVVIQAATHLTVQPPTNPIAGQALVVQITLDVLAPGAGTPTGTVDVSDGTVQCRITLPATSCTLPPMRPGTHTVTASYAGDTRFASSSAQLPLALKAAQIITFTSSAPLDARVGDVYTPQAIGGASGHPVVFSVAGVSKALSARTAKAAGAVCTISAGAVSFGAEGTCTITAMQDGNADYAAAPAVTQVIIVNAAAGAGAMPVPTLSMWAVTLLSLALAAFVAMGRRRK